MFSRILSRLRSRGRCVGVDLGASSIKVVRFAIEGDQPTEVVACSRPTPRGAFENYRLADPAAVGASLRDALEEAEAVGHSIAIALPAPAVMVKRIAVANRELGSVAARVRQEIAAVGRERDDQLTFDFQIIGASAVLDSVDVLIAGIRRELVDGYARAAKAARANLAVLDLDYFALQNVAEWQPQPPTRGVALLLHAGFRYTALNVVMAERSVFTAAIELGGKNLAAASTAETPPEVATAEFIASFCDDVHHTLNFYCSSLRERPIETILLSGGLAHVAGLAPALAARLGHAARVLAPLSPSDEWGMAAQPEFAVAAGLATRTVRDQ